MRNKNMFYFSPNFFLGDAILAVSSFSRSLLRTSFLLVGAILLAPTFLYPQLAQAQIGNDQSRLLLEVQQMRQEIAELRDSVDRQSFELRKLKQAQGSTVAKQQANNQPLVAPQLPQTQLPQTQQPQTQLPQAQLPQTQLPQATVATGQSAFPAATPAQFPPPAEPSLSQPASQPSYGAQVISSGNTNEVDLSGAATKPSTENTSNSQKQYPPVVDRSISPEGSLSAEGSLPAEDSLPAEGSYTNQASRSVSAVPSDAYVSANDVVPQAAPQAAPQAVQQGAQQGAQQTVPQAAPQAAPQVVSIPTAPVSPATTNTGVIAVPSVVPSTAPSAGAQVPNGSSAQVAISSPAVTQVPAPVPQAILPEQDYYQQGFSLLKQSRHEEAVSVFTQQIKAHPQGDFADDAYYWIAESMYVNRKLDVAKTNFSTILNNYKQSPRVPDAMLKIAYIEQDQGNQIEARLLLQDIMQYHPSSNAAISAKNRLAQLN